MRLHHLATAVDLAWVALSAIVAVLIRDNFVPYEPHLTAITAYGATAVATAALIFLATGLHKRLWQFTSLPDVLRIMAAVTVALLLALFISFVTSRLEGVARSVPLIQWFLLISAMVGTRVGVRIWHERSRQDRFATTDAPVQHVLIVGLSHLTELYLQSVAEYASKTVDVVGILSEQREFRGRSLRFQKVLGTPEELLQVISSLEVHGITLERIVVMQPAEELSRQALDAMLAVERSSGIQVDWLVERLGLIEKRAHDDGRITAPLSTPSAGEMEPRALEAISLGSYGCVKRVSDILGAVFLGVLFVPLILLVAILVALDVGIPLVFWQKRPGRLGRPFKLFKFCSMRPAHDQQGKRIPDEERSSMVGRLLRRTRLDELPQLYNVLIGEMSFVGPRPLLPVDQPEEMSSRLLIRPGLTGLAQVYGGRNISAEDKNALDIWYVRNASIWLDLKVLLRTPMVMMRGERVDHDTLCVARAGLERLKTQSTERPDSYSLISTGLVGDARVGITPPII